MITVGTTQATVARDSHLYKEINHTPSLKVCMFQKEALKHQTPAADFSSQKRAYNQIEALQDQLHRMQDQLHRIQDQLF